MKLRSSGQTSVIAYVQSARPAMRNRSANGKGKASPEEPTGTRHSQAVLNAKAAPTANSGTRGPISRRRMRPAFHHRSSNSTAGNEHVTDLLSSAATKKPKPRTYARICSRGLELEASASDLSTQ